MAKKPKEAGDTVKIPPKLGAFKASKTGQRKKVEAVSVRADVPNIRTSDPDAYAFTSPSTLLNRSAPEKRAHGCDTRLNKKGKPVFTGERGGIVGSIDRTPRVLILLDITRLRRSRREPENATQREPEDGVAFGVVHKHSLARLSCPSRTYFRGPLEAHRITGGFSSLA